MSGKYRANIDMTDKSLVIKSWSFALSQSFQVNFMLKSILFKLYGHSIIAREAEI